MKYSATDHLAFILFTFISLAIIIWFLYSFLNGVNLVELGYVLLMLIYAWTTSHIMGMKS